MAKSSKKSQNSKTLNFNNNRGKKLLIVAVLFGVLGVATLQLSSASPFTDYLQRLRAQSKSRWQVPSGTCSANVKTGNATATGNNMYTSVTQTGGPSGVSVKNTTTSYTNTGGKTAVGC